MPMCTRGALVWRITKWESAMKILKSIAVSVTLSLVSLQSALAATPPPQDIPEVDAAGSIIAIGLVAGLVALLRERFLRK